MIHDTVDLQPLHDDHLPEFARLLNLQRETPLTSAQLQEALERHRELSWRADHLLWDARHLVGSVSVMESRYTLPGRLLVDVLVHPDARRRGHGQTLLGHALRLTAERGAGGVEGNVSDGDHASLGWLTRRGFTERFHRFTSVLDLTAFDPTVHADRARPGGVKFVTLGVLESAEHDAALDLIADLLHDTPDLQDAPRWSREQVRDVVCAPGTSHPDWTVLAVDARTGRWLGVTVMTRHQDHAYNYLTGVLPHARGRGLARALKLQVIERARQEGFLEMHTHNLGQNTPMLAVNDTLGFERRAGRRVMQRPLE